MTIKPQGERILVKPDKTPQKVGSLYIPENAIKERTVGVVIAAAEGLEEQFPAGTYVLFEKYGGYRLPDDTILLKKDQIICIVEGDGDVD